MSKKPEANAPVAPATHPALGKTKEQWVAQFQAVGVAHARKARRVPIELTKLIAGAANFEAAIKADPKTHAAAVLFGLDENDWAAVHSLSDDLNTLGTHSPSDARKFEIVTPADDQLVADARQLVSDVRGVLNRCGGALDVTDQLDLLGRGDAVEETPSSVYDALNTLVSQAPNRAELLLEAGIIPETLAEATRFRDRLQQLMVETGQRRAQKTALPGDIAAGKRSLHAALTFGGGRISAALRGSPTPLDRVLATLPRRDERRKEPAAPGSSTEIEVRRKARAEKKEEKVERKELKEEKKEKRDGHREPAPAGASHGAADAPASPAPSSETQPGSNGAAEAAAKPLPPAAEKTA